MIFTDALFLVVIALPYFLLVFLFRKEMISVNILISALIGLSILYYYLGPAADMFWLFVVVLGNLALVRLGLRPTALLWLSIVNIALVFLLKAALPGGAPLGLSFIVFQVVGFILLVRAGAVREFPPADYLFCLMFFPHAVAGPILHWLAVQRYLQHAREASTYFRPASWILIFLGVGVAKKVLIADRLFVPIQSLQSGALPFGFVDSAIFPVLYGMYIYFDFSAYSDIATGLALLIGLRLPINFYSPYRSLSPMQFWHRWHRTLHKFLKKDIRRIYYDLGLPSGLMFVFFVFMFSGYWHGAGVGFMIWAFFHFLWLAFYPRRLMERLPVAVRWATNFSVVSLLWVPFALKQGELVEWAKGLLQISSAFDRDATGFVNLHIDRYDLTAISVAFVVAMGGLNAFQMARSRRLSGHFAFAACMLFILSWIYVVDPRRVSNPFVYFQF